MQLFNICELKVSIWCNIISSLQLFIDYWFLSYYSRGEREGILWILVVDHLLQQLGYRVLCVRVWWLWSSSSLGFVGFDLLPTITLRYEGSSNFSIFWRWLQWFWGLYWRDTLSFGIGLELRESSGGTKINLWNREHANSQLSYRVRSVTFVSYAQ